MAMGGTVHVGGFADCEACGEGDCSLASVHWGRVPNGGGEFLQAECATREEAYARAKEDAARSALEGLQVEYGHAHSGCLGIPTTSTRPETLWEVTYWAA